jgi:NhaP-type Na+/H+ or K+/H+ antiporter
MIDSFAGLPLAVLSESRTLFEAGLILVLLALGFGAGAIDALDPNALLGENLISTVVSIAVGIILFEAGLGLNFSGQAAASRP